MAGAAHRLFVALYPPREWSEGAIRSLEKLGPLVAHRMTPVEQVHMTLQFVGETPERELPEVMESVRRSAAGVGRFSLRPTKLVSMPRGKEPRLIAMETDAPGALLEIQQRLVKRLARRVKDSRFSPHITLLRFANQARVAAVEMPVELAGFEVREIVLVRSILRTAGAEHVRVERTALE